MSRVGKVTRKTQESEITVAIDLDGSGQSQISTGVPFYDHMLTALSKHSLIDMQIQASGDLEVDVHHTVEDTAICLGKALKQAYKRTGKDCYQHPKQQLLKHTGDTYISLSHTYSYLLLTKSAVHSFLMCRKIFGIRKGGERMRHFFQGGAGIFDLLHRF